MVGHSALIKPAVAGPMSPPGRGVSRPPTNAKLRRWLLDTGSTVTIMPERWVDELGGSLKPLDTNSEEKSWRSWPLIRLLCRGTKQSAGAGVLTAWGVLTRSYSACVELYTEPQASTDCAFVDSRAPDGTEVLAYRKIERVWVVPERAARHPTNSNTTLDYLLVGTDLIEECELLAEFPPRASKGQQQQGSRWSLTPPSR